VAAGQDVPTLLRAGKFHDALIAIDGALKTEPQDPRLLAFRGIALSGLGDEAQALAAYRSALQVSPKYVSALEGAAEIEYKTGDPAAMAHLDLLLNLQPSDVTAHAMRGELAARKGECQRAVADFEAGMRAAETQREALRHYGACAAKLGQIERAEQVFGELVSREPQDASARYSLAAIELQANQFDKALQTLAPPKNDARAMALAAEAYEGLGRTPDAIQTLRAAIVAAPAREDLYARFAELCFTYKSYEAGIAMLDAGLRKIPGSPKLHIARGVLLVQEGHYDQADQEFAEAEKLDPHEPASADAAILSLIQANRLEDAERTIESTLKRRPQDPQLAYFLADVLSRKGASPGSPGFSRALAAAQHAVELQPSLVFAHDLLSRLYLQSGRQADAIRECYSALKYDADDETALYRLLRILKARGQGSDAAAIEELTKKWIAAREQQRVAEQREGEFRIRTVQ
jgi:tetratricopeptide (TPR) repeat protein